MLTIVFFSFEKRLLAICLILVPSCTCQGIGYRDIMNWYLIMSLVNNLKLPIEVQNDSKLRWIKALLGFSFPTIFLSLISVAYKLPH